MVRILKVKELEERKRQLLARSEMHRQTLTLEVANIKFSAALHKRRFKLLLKSSRWLGLVLPLAGLLLFRRRPHPSKTENGFISKLLSGLKLFGQLRPFLQGIRGAMKREPKRDDFTQFS